MNSLRFLNGYALFVVVYTVVGAAGVIHAEAPTRAAAPDTVRIVDAGDYSSLQEAFDAVPEGGAVVQLPPGRFVIDQPLVLERSHTRIQGSGAGTQIINENTSGEPALIIRHEDNRGGPDERGPRIWGIHLADFYIGGGEESGDGVLALGVNELYIHGLTVDEHGGSGIRLVDCYENPRISENNITYNRDAGLLIEGGHDIVVNGNEFEENGDGVRALDSFNLTMNGNNLDDHLGNGVVVENTYGSVLSGNTIEESQNKAMVFDRDSYGITISANVIANNHGGGVDLRDAWGFAISGNTFTRVENRSIIVGANSGRISITGNNFSNTYTGEGVLREGEYATGILLEDTEAVTITGNVFSGMYEEAVKQVGQIDHLVLTGNVMMDGSRAEPGRHPAVDLEDRPDVMENNSIED